MEINLLPELPASKKYLWPIAILAGTVMISLSAFVGLQLWEKSGILKEKTNLLNQLKEQHELRQTILNKSKEESQLFSAYLENYNEFKKMHVNLVPFIDDMSKRLPNSGYLTTIEWTDEGMIHLIGEFSSLDIIGQYVQLLEQLNWVEDVHVLNVENQENENDLPDNRQSSKPLFQFEMEIMTNSQEFYKRGINE